MGEEMKKLKQKELIELVLNLLLLVEGLFIGILIGVVLG